VCRGACAREPQVLKLMQGPVTAAQNSLQDFAKCIQKRNASLQLTGGFQPSSGAKSPLAPKT
jgi:hypothetical protein